jgi:hypothetical protein
MPAHDPRTRAFASLSALGVRWASGRAPMRRDFARLYCDSCKHRQLVAFAHKGDIVAVLRERNNARPHERLEKRVLGAAYLSRFSSRQPLRSSARPQFSRRVLQLMAAALLTGDL